MILKICQFFVLPVNFWAFWWKPRDSIASGFKMAMH